LEPKESGGTETSKFFNNAVEGLFEIVKKRTRSVSKGYSHNFDTKVTQGEKEVAKRRVDAFYGLQQGELVFLLDGKDKKVRFRLPQIKRDLPKAVVIDTDELKANFERVHREVQSIFK